MLSTSLVKFMKWCQAYTGQQWTHPIQVFSIKTINIMNKLLKVQINNKNVWKNIDEFGLKLHLQNGLKWLLCTSSGTGSPSSVQWQHSGLCFSMMEEFFIMSATTCFTMASSGTNHLRDTSDQITFSEKVNLYHQFEKNMKRFFRIKFLKKEF